jgi:hypothetical protein
MVEELEVKRLTEISQQQHEEVKIELTVEDEQRLFYPLVFSAEDSRIVRKEQRRINFHIQNVFQGTLAGRGIGDDELDKKKETKPKIPIKVKSRKLNMSLWECVTRFTGYKDKKTQYRELKETATIEKYVVQKPLGLPTLRCIADKETI